MATMTRNVLVIGVSREEYDKVAPFLDRDAFDVDRFPSATGALELLAEVPFEVLLVRHPLHDMELASFLLSVRADGSPCQQAPLVVLAAGDDDAARAYLGHGANRVIGLEESAPTLQILVSGLLNVAPRMAARFMTRVEVKLGGAKDMITCQTVNISDSGMLIETDRRYDKGTRINVAFNLEDDERPISGVAEVVRHTQVGRDPVDGIGLRFLSFAGDSQRRFQSFLQRF